jgi:hypothetical protein
MTEYEALQQKIKDLEKENEMLKLDNKALTKSKYNDFNLYSMDRDMFSGIFLKDKKWNYNQEQIDAFWEYYDEVQTEDIYFKISCYIQEYIRHFNANYLDDYLEEQEKEKEWNK